MSDVVIDKDAKWEVWEDQVCKNVADFMYAASSGDTPELQRLLKRVEIDLDYESSNWSAAYWAARNGHVETLKFLFELPCTNMTERNNAAFAGAIRGAQAGTAYFVLDRERMHQISQNLRKNNNTVIGSNSVQERYQGSAFLTAAETEIGRATCAKILKLVGEEGAKEIAKTMGVASLQDLMECEILKKWYLFVDENRGENGENSDGCTKK